jgi:hypothetical protein
MTFAGMMEEMDVVWPLLAKFVVYTLSFWIFGWRVVHRKPLPALGWAFLGGVARWLGGLVLGGL